MINDTRIGESSARDCRQVTHSQKRTSPRYQFLVDDGLELVIGHQLAVKVLEELGVGFVDVERHGELVELFQFEPGRIAAETRLEDDLSDPWRQFFGLVRRDDGHSVSALDQLLHDGRQTDFVALGAQNGEDQDAGTVAPVAQQHHQQPFQIHPRA